MIKTLTGQANNDIMNDEIRDYICSTEDNLKNAAIISKNMTKAKIKIQWLFWQSLRSKLESRGLNLKDELCLKWQNVNGYYTKSRNRDIYYGLWSKIYNVNGITIHFGIEVENQVYYGFTIEKDDKGGISQMPEYQKFRDMVYSVDNNYKGNDYWLGYKYLEKNLDFRAFNSQNVFDLADRDKLEKVTSLIAENIINEIKQLEEKLNA